MKIEAMQSVDEIVVNTNPIIRDTKALLENAKKELLEERLEKRNPTALRMDENLYHSATKKYQSTILRFQKALGRFTDAKVEDFTRQARIVNPDIEQVQLFLAPESN